MTHKYIDRALRSGLRLHAFLSGGGLRVVRVENDGKLAGYGEHPYIQEALRLADKTLRPLGRMPKKSKYLTGSATAIGPLDEWVLSGNTFDAWVEDNKVVVQLINKFYGDSCPTAVLEDALRNGSAEWNHRGGITKIHNVRCGCGSNHAYGQVFDKTHWSYSLETIQKSGRSSYYPVAKTGYGADFGGALENALAAPQLELEEKAKAA